MNFYIYVKIHTEREREREREREYIFKKQMYFSRYIFLVKIRIRIENCPCQ
jgi:hypothetical protein